MNTAPKRVVLSEMTAPEHPFPWRTVTYEYDDDCFRDANGKRIPYFAVRDLANAEHARAERLVTAFREMLDLLDGFVVEQQEKTNALIEGLALLRSALAENIEPSSEGGGG